MSQCHYFRFIRTSVAKHIIHDDGILADFRAGRQNLSADVGNYEQFNIQAALSIGELQISYPGSEGRNVGSVGWFVRWPRQTWWIRGASNAQSGDVFGWGSGGPEGQATREPDGQQ